MATDRRARKRARRWLFGLALCSGVLWTSGIGAKEPVQKVLDGLRQRGSFDTVQEYLQYLERMRTNPLVFAGTKQLIPYKQGRIFVELSQNEASPKERLKLLDRASKRFNEFLKKSPKHFFAGRVGVQLGDVFIERGRMMVDQARNPKNADKKDALLAAARKEFKTAQTIFKTAQKQSEAELKGFPAFIPRDQKETRRLRHAVWGVLLQAKLNFTKTIYQQGLSYETESSKERKQLMTAAAASFHKLHEDNPNNSAGLTALMSEGRCYQYMGDLQRALALYGELELELPPNLVPLFRDLQAKVLRLAMEAWNDPRQSKIFQSEKRGVVWLSGATPSEEETPAGLGIQYLLAQAKHLILLADHKTPPEPNQKGVKAPKSAGKFSGSQRQKLQDEIVKLLRKVAAKRNEFQQAAKELLAKYRDVKQEGPSPKPAALGPNEHFLMTGAANSLSFSPDGKKLVSVGYGKDAASVWDVTTGKMLAKLYDPYKSKLFPEIRRGSVLYASAWSPDGKTIALAGDDAVIRLWDAKTLKIRVRLEGHLHTIKRLLFTSDSKTLVVGLQAGVIEIWDLDAKNRKRTIYQRLGVGLCALSPNDKLLAITESSRTIGIWDMASGKLKAKLPRQSDDIYGMAFSPDGKKLATVGLSNNVDVWDVAQRRLLFFIRGEISSLDVAFSPDGKYIAATAAHEALGLFDARNGEQILLLKAHDDGVMSLAFSRDGRSLAAGERGMFLWDLASRLKRKK